MLRLKIANGVSLAVAQRSLGRLERRFNVTNAVAANVSKPERTPEEIEKARLRVERYSVKSLLYTLPEGIKDGVINAEDATEAITKVTDVKLGNDFLNSMISSMLQVNKTEATTREDLDKSFKAVDQFIKAAKMKPNADTFTALMDASLRNGDMEKLNEVVQKAKESKILAMQFATSKIGKNKRIVPALNHTPDPNIAIKLPEKNESPHILPFKTQEEAIEAQYSLEIRAAEQGAAVANTLRDSLISMGLGSTIKMAHPIAMEWFQPLQERIGAERDSLLNDPEYKTPGKTYFAPVIVNLRPDTLALLTIHRAFGLVLKNKAGVHFRELSLAIGALVEAEYKARLSPGKKSKTFMKSQELEEHEWSIQQKLHVGALLASMLIESATVPTQEPEDSYSITAEPSEVREPAFTHKRSYTVESDTSPGLVIANPIIFEWLKDIETRVDMTSINAYPPMVVKPIPWKQSQRGSVSGGYLTLKVPVMRFHGSKIQATELKKGDLSRVLQSLNILGSTAWKINIPVLDVVEQVWKEGGGIGEIPSKQDKPIPAPPKDYLTNDVARRSWQREMKRVQQANRDLHGLRCDTELKLRVAREIKFLNEIYFPHNLDFRGRTYPVPPHLNHLGSDMCRALLQFSKGKPLGEHGLKWLMIHLANIYGKGKQSFADRAKFTLAHLDDIRDSAEKPLEGNRWWLGAEDPWQCLGACIELNAAMKLKNPADFISFLPVHMDGSCNGLQHYAAMGGDELGAALVNLSPSDKPQDVYQGVANLVAQKVAADAAAGHEVALLVNGKIERKLVKQTVMTSVYGVTFIGARQQIANALVDRATLDDEDALNKVALYLAATTLSAIKEMFLGAREIMEWLADAAYKISLHNKPVMWVSPIGLPVVQPYRKTTRTLVRTIAQDVTLLSNDDSRPVSQQKQKSAFPPNYVHSLDSSHMMMTSIKCAEHGLTFGSVHDSFWTHATDIDKLNTILREEFVKLHRYPLLEDLEIQFRQNVPGIEFAPLPPRGKFNLDLVLNSPYFFH